MRRERDEYLALAQRTQADFENYRKRAAQEAAAAGERAEGGLRRASCCRWSTTSSGRSQSAGDGEEHLADGVRLVHSELVAVLARNGVEQFDPRGEQFDPTVHEALSTREDGDAGAGVVLDVVEKGYRAERRRPASGPRGRLGGELRMPAVKNPYEVARRRQEGLRRGDQEGLPQARAPVPPGQEPGRHRGRGALQGDPGGLRVLSDPEKRKAVRLGRRHLRRAASTRAPSARRWPAASAASATSSPTSSAAPRAGGRPGGRRAPSAAATSRPRSTSPSSRRWRARRCRSPCRWPRPARPVAAPAPSPAPRRRSAAAARAAASRPSRRACSRSRSRAASAAAPAPRSRTRARPATARARPARSSATRSTSRPACATAAACGSPARARPAAAAARPATSTWSPAWPTRRSSGARATTSRSRSRSRSPRRSGARRSRCPTLNGSKRIRVAAGHPARHGPAAARRGPAEARAARAAATSTTASSSTCRARCSHEQREVVDELARGAWTATRASGILKPEGRLMADGERDRGVYMISVAAELAGMHPQTLRIYETRGLITPKRSPKNTRLYSRGGRRAAAPDPGADHRAGHEPRRASRRSSSSRSEIDRMRRRMRSLERQAERMRGGAERGGRARAPLASRPSSCPTSRRGRRCSLRAVRRPDPDRRPKVRSLRTRTR